jgi:hypothetical protein
MWKAKVNELLYLAVVVLITACLTTKNNQSNQQEAYIP